MTTTSCNIGRVTVGKGHSLAIIAGPCVLEEPATNDAIAQCLRDECAKLGLSFIFKASFDKANRSSILSARGPGIGAGLRELDRLKSKFNIPVTTDIHQPSQAADAARIVDLLQVPAFLCRQTDLLLACADTGKPVNVKKGQFVSPNDMRHVMKKLAEGGCREMMLTERGTFFGYQRLVNDFIGVGDLLDLGPPVCFDVTHSTQLPGADGSTSGGVPTRAGLLLRAAVAAGVHALFLECHPSPESALSDSSTMQSLETIPKLLQDAAKIHHCVTS